MPFSAPFYISSVLVWGARFGFPLSNILVYLPIKKKKKGLFLYTFRFRICTISKRGFFIKKKIFPILQNPNSKILGNQTKSNRISCYGMASFLPQAAVYTIRKSQGTGNNQNMEKRIKLYSRNNSLGGFIMR